MNETDYLYLDREKNRIENELHNVLESGSKADLREAIARIDKYKALKYRPEEPITVKSVIQDLAELSMATGIKNTENGESITLIEFQDMVFNRVDQLADILGIKLEEWEGLK